MHLKHLDGSTEKVPYFCLPANELNDVIAPSCYSCFDYPNALADLARAPVTDACLAADAHVETACGRSVRCAAQPRSCLEPAARVQVAARVSNACSAHSSGRQVAERQTHRSWAA